MGVHGVAPGRQIVPACSAAELGVGRDYCDSRPDQVVPVADMFGITFPYQEYDGRDIRGAAIGQAFLPVGRDLTGQLRNRIDIGREGESQQVRAEPLDYRLRLRGWRLGRLDDFYLSTGLGQPFPREGGIEFVTHLAGRV